MYLSIHLFISIYVYINGLYISVMQQSAQEKERGRSGIIFLFKLTSPIISNLEIGPLNKNIYALSL